MERRAARGFAHSLLIRSLASFASFVSFVSFAPSLVGCAGDDHPMTSATLGATTTQGGEASANTAAGGTPTGDGPLGTATDSTTTTGQPTTTGDPTTTGELTTATEPTTTSETGSTTQLSTTGGSTTEDELCGNGLDDDGEECDYAIQGAPDFVCNEACKKTGVIVFVTSTLHQGDLGGLDGADALCAERAAAAKLSAPTSYHAWLSTTEVSANERVVQADYPYYLLDGTMIAEDWAALTDGDLANPIDVDESMETVAGTAWTNTSPYNGNKLGDDCAGFTSGDAGETGRFGRVDEVNPSWTNQSPGKCNSTRRLYCIGGEPSP